METEVEKLKTALRRMHSTVHGGVYRSGSPFKDIPGARTIGPHVLGEINTILRDALGRDDPSLKYFRFPDDGPADSANEERK